MSLHDLQIPGGCLPAWFSLTRKITVSLIRFYADGLYAENGPQGVKKMKSRDYLY